jgi:hypothetical protein
LMQRELALLKPLIHVRLLESGGSELDLEPHLDLSRDLDDRLRLLMKCGSPEALSPHRLRESLCISFPSRAISVSPKWLRETPRKSPSGAACRAVTAACRTPGTYLAAGPGRSGTVLVNHYPDRGVEGVATVDCSL